MTTVLESVPRPTRFESVDHLEEYMSTPTQALVDDLARIDGDIAVLGAAGKMGVTLSRMLKRAAPDRRIFAVSRFSSAGVRERLESWGVETVQCDLLEPGAVKQLPKVPNVIYMAGLKFESGGREDLMWAMNVIVPGHVAQAYRESRIVALSTIHVYPWSDPVHGGAGEQAGHPGLAGEYAYSVMGRERVFQYYSGLHATPGRLVRFVYAIDPRYGVLEEIARWVRDGLPVPVDTGVVNLMWQGDAINQFARLLARCTTPTSPLNVGMPESVSVRKIARTFAEIYGVTPSFLGQEAECLVVDTDRATQLLGQPLIDLRTMCEWVADWVDRGLPTLGLPSKFEVRTGIF